ncbi:DEAD-box protein abstrakt [Mycena indigotica]|uniref:DEAD-box protein abstrakt n=1 Tax=Mycena indigotica TaxID=2126181 RepID=A0A8H6S9C4_9AGAR|nr:DEAD-box protein abstrakt [Mycena indigotica]KAF7295234.1 DEAD-box protein abstrakt [Mycena indigotica]
MPLLVLYNPVSGSGSAKAFFEDHVLPLLKKNDVGVDIVASTERADHAGEILVKFMEAHEGEISVVLGSGDGTLNECMTALSKAPFIGKRATSGSHRVSFALVPCGTANALYSTLFPPQPEQPEVDYRLQSVNALINRSKTVPLHLAISTLSSAPFRRKRPEVRVSAVVVSTCLHAAILKDSEKLRAEMPGVERFKVAAEQNANTWSNSAVKLLPAPNAGVVQIYDPVTKAFIAHPESDPDEDAIVDMDGPFSYFLATVNVDRLEPNFVITPLASKFPSTEATCDIVIVRPLRSPAVESDTPDARAAFVPILWKTFGEAYRGGGHVDLTYDEEGAPTATGDGETVVEYIRCGGFEWIPDPEDESAHYLCTDGIISKIESDGRLVCTAASPDANGGFRVYV